ncbi:MAG: hypothetical protein ACPGOY_18905 [Rhodospirillaceae bacterium]
MRMFAVAAISFVFFLVVLPAAPFAQNVGDGLSPSELGPLHIQVLNSASDDCWTNSDDVRDYAKDLLETKGYDTYFGDEDNIEGYTFFISVVARRHFGNCVGHIDLVISRVLWSGNTLGLYIVARDARTFAETNGANTILFERVQRFVENVPNG